MTIYKCGLPRGCKGGNETGNQLCHPGYTGPRCGICQSGYYKSMITDACQSCNGSFNYYMTYISSLVLVIIFLLLVILFRRMDQLYPASVEVSNRSNGVRDDEILETSDIIKVNNENIEANNFYEGKFGKNIRILNLIRIILTTFQLIGSSVVQLHMNLLPNFASLWILIQKLNLDFMSFFNISCYTSVG
jgi:hypothetical protein